MPPFRGSLILLLMGVCALSQGVPAAAQPSTAPADPPPAPAAAPATTAPNGRRPAPTGSQADVMYMRTKEGELVPVFDGASLEEFLAFLKKRSELTTQPAPYYLTSVALEGDADNDWANLSARVRIQVNSDEGAVRVPLRMSEGTLRDFRHEGPGEAVSSELDTEQGYVWWLSGKGLHTLTLVMSVPLRKELPARRLQLSLPATAVSELQLRVPQARVTARADERSRLNVAPHPEGGTKIGVIGLGTRLDVSWQPQPELVGVETVLEARTSLSVSLDGESVLLEANQKVAALQGSFEELKVWLPAGYELLKVEGAAYKEHRAAPDNLNQITVILKEPGVGPVELKWTVRADLPSLGEKITLEGFEVERARIQTGHLAVRIVGAFRVAKVDAEDRFIQRINASSLSKVIPAVPGPGEISSAYQILKQPFRLALRLEKVQPFLTVKPYLFVNLAADRAELEAIFQYQVFRGGVEELAWDWANWKQEGWKLERIETVEGPERVEQTLSGDPAAPALIRAQLIEPTTGRFDLRIKAQRTLSPDMGASELTLPTPNVGSQSPAVVVVTLADNVEADFKPTGETTIRPLTAAVAEGLPVPKSLRELRRNAYWIDSRAQSFKAAVAVQKQRVTTETDVAAALHDTQMSISQRLAYGVAYGRLSSALVLVPAELADRCRFSLDGKELLPVATGVSEDGARQYRLALDPPRINRFEVLAEYTVPRLSGEDRSRTELAVPMLQSSDAPFSSSRFRLADAARLSVSVADAGWERRPGSDGNALWVAPAGVAPRLVLLVDHAAGESDTGAVLERGLIRAVFDQQGTVRYRAQYRISGAVSRLKVEFPAAVRPQFWSDDTPIADEFPDLAADSVSFDLTLPDHEAADRERLLTIVYQDPLAIPFTGPREQRLIAPRIAGELRAAQLIWEVVLPFDQHLFTTPEASTPLFTWRWSGAFWCRRGQQSEGDLERWIEAEDGPPAKALTTRGNSYCFSSLGPPPTLTFWTMSRHMIVLIGAGLALSIGFVLMNVPFTRNVLTLLLLLFLTTVLALWYPEPVFVLLQPAALGLLLAVTSAVIQGALRRSREARVLTLASPSGFMNPASSVRRDSALGVGSNEATSLRAAAGHSP